MKKNHFQKEVLVSQKCQKKSKGKDVKKIQEWLNLHAIADPECNSATSIDEDFGPATELALNNFLEYKKLNRTGVVDQDVFEQLCSPLFSAFKKYQGNGSNLRAAVVQTALHHLKSRPVELQIKGVQNLGPWVRSYCQGNEGNSWLWCMGFVQTIIDQAATSVGLDFTKYMPISYSCDVIALHAQHTGRFVKHLDIRNNPGLVKPGDIFLVQKTQFDWVHTGIIISVTNDCFETIEGNTNTDGSSNGVGVYRRTRNFLKSKLDVFSLEDKSVIV